MDAAAFNAFETAGWERVAPAYERFFGPITSRVVDRLLDAAGVAAGTRLLDVAAGAGHLSARAAERGASPVGVDMAEAMVALARRRHPRLEFVRGDAEALPFAPESFDAAAGNFAILHVGRPERVAAELHRVLAPGGRVALTVWDLPARARFVGVLLDAAAEAGAQPPPELPEGPPFFRFSDDGEFARLLGDAGFSDVGVETVSFAHAVESADALWDGLLGGTVRTAPLVERQDEKTRARIRAAFERGLEAYAGPDGLELPVSVKLASGTRAR